MADRRAAVLSPAHLDRDFPDFCAVAFCDGNRFRFRKIDGVEIRKNLDQFLSRSAKAGSGIGQIKAGEESQEAAEEADPCPSCESGLEGARRIFQETAPDAQIKFFFQDRLYKIADVTRVMLPVAIDLDRNVIIFVTSDLKAGLNRTSNAKIEWECGYQSSGLGGFFFGKVTRTVINDDPVRLREGRSDLSKESGNGTSFIEGRNDNQNFRVHRGPILVYYALHLLELKDF